MKKIAATLHKNNQGKYICSFIDWNAVGFFFFHFSKEWQLGTFLLSDPCVCSCGHDASYFVKTMYAVFFLHFLGFCCKFEILLLEN